ncbi:MAG TPA: carboxymuconolactone decarboxylase family protein [Acidimicrobiales bacterium]
MADTDPLEPARAMRRSILGDDFVDAMTADPDELDFQDHLTRQAWGAWARGGPLSPRDRSLLVLAMTAALGRMEEFRLHAAASHRAGVTDAELYELLFQISGYCGGPAALAARREIRAVQAERDRPDPGGATS